MTTLFTVSTTESGKTKIGEIKMLDFKKLLFEGTLTEMSVMKVINDNKETTRDFLLEGSVTHKNEWSWTCVEADRTDLFDLRLNIEDTEAHYSVEVKSAKNGGKFPTFFAETLSIGSNTYPEYLKAEPTFICYVDSISHEHFWYDGKKFVEQVKANIDNEFLNGIGTARGVKFGKQDKSWGFLGTYTPDFTWNDLVVEFGKEIRARLNDNEKQGSTVKAVSGLKTLQ